VSYDVKLKIHQDFTADSNEILAAIDRAAAGKDPGANWPSRMPEAGTISLRSNLPAGNALRDQSTTLYAALQRLAEATQDIVGRKNLIFFGTGVELGQVAAFGLAKPDPRYWPATLQALNDHNVAVYPVDLVPSETDYAMQSNMHRLADETGGRYFWNFTNFLTPLKQMGQENSGYYLLSYRATHPAGATGFQKVKVRLKNPEFKVKSRSGYAFGEQQASL
jgi:VWFA-related protein